MEGSEGALDAAGNANVAQWPNATAVGTGVRGGDYYYFGVDNLRVSGRGFAAYASAARSGNFGWRGARAAP